MSEDLTTPPVGGPNLEDILANMELRALRVEYPDERARIFNLAGDLCFDAGLRERALSYYGRGIDVFLAAAQVDAAVAVCRKIVRLTPEVVRARCTLAWMALGRGLIREARQRIADYAAAASSAGQEQKAARHLRLMTDVSANVELLESLADGLKQLGDTDGAAHAFDAAMSPREFTHELPAEPSQRWSTVLRLLSSDEPALEMPRVQKPAPPEEVETAEIEIEPTIAVAVGGGAPISMPMPMQTVPPDPASMRTLQPRTHRRAKR